jgi:hypothetical protein
MASEYCLMLERELPRAEQRLAEYRELLSQQVERIARLEHRGITKPESRSCSRFSKTLMHCIFSTSSELSAT